MIGNFDALRNHHFYTSTPYRGVYPRCNRCCELLFRSLGPETANFMAEIVGLVAGGAGLASLAVQILENTRILADFYSTVRDAPEQIGVILEEIDVLAHVLVEFSRIQGLRTTGLTDITTQIQVNTIHQCKIASDCLSNIVSELNTGMRLQPRRFSLLTALRTRKLDKLLLRLERAKSTLTLAQILYLQ